MLQPCRGGAYAPRSSRDLASPGTPASLSSPPLVRRSLTYRISFRLCRNEIYRNLHRRCKLYRVTRSVIYRPICQIPTAFQQYQTTSPSPVGRGLVSPAVKRSAPNPVGRGLVSRRSQGNNRHDCPIRGTRTNDHLCHCEAAPYNNKHYALTIRRLWQSAPLE